MNVEELKSGFALCSISEICSLTSATVRLLDHEGLNQEQCAARMGVARTTVTAMYESARKKLVSAVVERKRLCIAGGNIEIDRERNPLSVDIKSKGEKRLY